MTGDSNPQVTDLLAEAFVAEGVEAVFALLGDANMYWAATMAKKPGVRLVHARHEHCAVAMADGYARMTGKVGVATTTCGPGFTQIMTALTAAARARTPMVIFAGDAPIASTWYLQQIDMAPLTLATGAAYVAIRHLDSLLDKVREAFQIAQLEQRPVVLGVPMDLQKQVWPHMMDYTPSADLLPAAQRPQPDPELVERALDMIAQAERPIILAGRGAVSSQAREALEALAERTGALVATTLLAKGFFDGNPYSLDIAGAFASDRAHEFFAEADLVIGVGAGLGHYTTESGYLYPGAQVIQIDSEPRGLWQGLRTADLHLRADARAAAQALLQGLTRRDVSVAEGFRTPATLDAIATDVPDAREYPERPGLLDPRKAALALDKILPRDWTIIVGSGHYNSFVMTHLRGRGPEQYKLINDFGAIGSGLSAAIGAAVARGDGKLALIEGDGSLLMHVQELETVRRHGVRMLIAVMNDGGYGAEFHKFRAHGIDPTEAMHGRGDLAEVARAFGLRGARVDRYDQLGALFEAHRTAGTGELWDLQIDDAIASRSYRKVHFGEA
jgi:acetolactate synthase-1/2/3 large subunit